MVKKSCPITTQAILNGSFGTIPRSHQLNFTTPLAVALAGDMIELVLNPRAFISLEAPDPPSATMKQSPDCHLGFDLQQWRSPYPARLQKTRKSPSVLNIFEQPSVSGIHESGLNRMFR